MAYVNKNEVLGIYGKINPVLGVEGEPLFVENLEGLVALITSAFSGQTGAGAAEAQTKEVKEYQGIAVETGNNEDTTGGDSGVETKIVNTDTPLPQSDEASVHEKGKGGNGKGKGSEGKEGDGGEDGEGEGKGKEGGKEGKGKGQGEGKEKGNGEGDESQSGADGQGEEEGQGEGQSEGQGEGEDEGDEDGQGEQDNPNNSEEEEDQQKEEQQPEEKPEDSESQVEQMDDETIYAYQFKFQKITNLFFGTPMSYNTWGSDNALFVELENLIKTGIAISIHDNVEKNYSQYPDRELMVRKKRALDLLGRIDLMMNTEFLKISDDEGNATELRQQATREQMNLYVTCDKLVERLLPLFFVFRKELFGNNKLVEYANFCLLFLGRKKRFLRIKDWHNSNLETTIYDFYSVDVVSIGNESATVFVKRHDVETSVNYSWEDELYRIEDGVLINFSTDRRVIIDLQMFVRNLVSYYLANDSIQIREAVSNHEALAYRAEYTTSHMMRIHLESGVYKKLIT